MIKQSLLNTPHLIIIEGPASVGKTSVVNHLKSRLDSLDIPAGIIPEFSDNSLGSIVEANAAYGKSKPGWLKGLGGFFAFLSDKITSLNKIRENPENTWICDRYFDTQLIIGAIDIEQHDERVLSQSITKEIISFYSDKLPANTLFVFLKADITMLHSRLQERIGRELTEMEAAALNKQVTGYNEMKSVFVNRRLIEVDNSGSITITIQNILNQLHGNIG
jgi:thymidylate kinase